MKTIINSPKLAKPSGYSHGILAQGRTLYLSGQPGLDASGKVIAPGDLVAQFKLALENIQTVVVQAGGKMTDVVKITFYVRDRNDYKSKLKPIGAVYKSFFQGYYPATTLVEISDLFDDGALIEIDATAMIE